MLTSPEATLRQIRALRKKVAAKDIGINRDGIVDLITTVEWLATQNDALLAENERLTTELAEARRD